MLQSLRIRNLVIIEDLSLDFAPGLNLLTGETGTGKSIVVEAVGLVAGKRADRSMVRTGADKAVVEALFRIEADAPVARWLADSGIADGLEDGELVVRREVSAGGGTIRINGSPVTLTMLAELGARLFELHGQHESRSLLVPERHLGVLDRFGGLEREVAAVGEAHRDFVAAEEALGRLLEESRGRGRRIEALDAVLREIDAVAPVPGEIDSLDRERSLLRNAETVARLLDEVVAASYEAEPSATSLAAAAARSARRLAEIDPAVEEIAGRLESARVEIQDAGEAMRDYRERLAFEPGRLEQIETRRAELQRLLLKYGEDEQAVLSARETAAEERARLTGHDEQVREAEEGRARAAEVYVERARALGRRRAAAARKLEPAVRKQLAPLALGQAQFAVELSATVGEAVPVEGDGSMPLHPRGAERAEFRLAANPGEPPRPLQKVASGGELSRVMLALHVAVDGAGEDRVLIFDEIDAGVGGRAADAVGRRLATLARHSQVLCVTHLPQVAVYADRHFSVRKWVEGERTHTAVDCLDPEARVEELARMLGGKQATATSRRHAEELLAGATTGRPARGARRRA